MRFGIAILILLGCLPVLAQTNQPKDIDIERFIEEVFAVQNGDVSAEELYETLLLFYSNPINLNNTDIDELRSLFILSEVQLQSFFDYTQTQGNLLSIYELQAIPNFDLPTIYRMQPFVTVNETGLNADNRGLLKRMLSEENNYLLLRYEQTLEERRGYSPREDSTSSRYLGSPSKYYARFRVSHINDFSFGVTAEKDAGEELIWDPNTKRYGADFYSAHLQVKNQGFIKNVVLGDYQIQFGQSLLLGAGFSVGKGAETISTVRRSNLGIRPYTSVIETNFFRGAAATFEVRKNLELTTFYSNLNQDATLRSDTVEQEDFITSIQLTGFHRTVNEVNAKSQINEQNYGGTLLYKIPKANANIGLTAIANTLSRPLIRANRIYNHFEFSGTDNLNIGLFGDYIWQNFSFFGEMARSKSGGLGAVAGVISSITSKIETSIVLRSYAPDFHTFYGNAFGESTRNVNEKGWYWGLKYKPNRKYEFTAYFDSFEFDWLRNGINAPSRGYEYLIRANYKPTRYTLLYFQFREQSKGDNPSSEEQEVAIRFPLEGIKRNYIINLDVPASEKISFKSRVQWSDYQFNETTTKGIAVWQDVNLDFNKIKFSARFAIFDTDDFNNAQYGFERDLLYAFAVPAYSGRGTRQYILMQYKPLKKLTFWVKYARTHFRDRDVISSGLETINGNIRTDLKVQARINF